MIFKVTDYQDRGTSGVMPRPVFINTTYVVAMEPWGTKYKVFVGRSLEYVVSVEDAERLGGQPVTSPPAPSEAKG